jgi:DNA-binding CsgD family transcriptional regulator
MQQISKENLSDKKKYGSRNVIGTVLIKPRRWTYLQNRFDLTPRERQIAELVCQGLRNDDIADILEITAGTAKTHIRNIYRKVHVKSKISMLLMFISAAEALND